MPASPTTPKTTPKTPKTQKKKSVSFKKRARVHKLKRAAHRELWLEGQALRARLDVHLDHQLWRDRMEDPEDLTAAFKQCCCIATLAEVMELME